MPLAKCLALPAGPSSVGKAGVIMLNASCQVPCFTSGARPVHFDRQMYSFFFRAMPLATCLRFSAATGSFLCRNEFLPGVLDNYCFCYFSFEYISLKRSDSFCCFSFEYLIRDQLICHAALFEYLLKTKVNPSSISQSNILFRESQIRPADRPRIKK